MVAEHNHTRFRGNGVMVISQRRLYAGIGAVGGLVMLILGTYYLMLDISLSEGFSKLFADASVVVSGAVLLFIGSLYALRD